MDYLLYGGYGGVNGAVARGTSLKLFTGDVQSHRSNRLDTNARCNLEEVEFQSM